MLEAKSIWHDDMQQKSENFCEISVVDAGYL